VSTAEGLTETDSCSTYVLAYDAARFACTALLAQQCLRSGGHSARPKLTPVAGDCQLATTEAKYVSTGSWALSTSSLAISTLYGGEASGGE